MSDNHITLRDYLDDKFEDLKEDIQRIEQHIASQNDRLGRLEPKVAVLESQTGKATTISVTVATSLVALAESIRWLLPR